MDPDIALVFGILLGGFAAMSILSALIDKRTPLVPVISLAVSLGLIGFAFWQHPEGYTLTQIGDAFIAVIGKML